MSPKAAIVIGVLVVALFVAVVVAGDDQEGSGFDHHALIDRLRDAAGDPSAVPREAIEAGCSDEDDPDLLEFTGGCVLVVRSDDELGLVGLLAETAIAIEAPAPDGDVDVEADVDAGEETSVAVGDGETVIELSCAGLSTCRVRLTGES